MTDDEYDGGGWWGHRERRPLLRGTKACRKLRQITRNKFDFSNCTISISLISNRNSFRVPFDKMASVHFLTLKNVWLFLHWKWPAQETRGPIY